MQRFQVLALCAAFSAGSGVLLAAGDAAKGKQVFEQCGVCHSTGTDKKMGPGLKGLYKKDKLVNGKKPGDPTIRARIDEGGNGMPGYKDMLSDKEKDDLLAYLKTL
jgi:cytochrome c